MLFIESFAEKYKREFLDRREQSKALFDLAKGILGGEPSRRHIDKNWWVLLIDEKHPESVGKGQTILLPSNEQIDVAYRFTVLYKTHPDADARCIYDLLDICISETMTVASDSLRSAVVGYPELVNNPVDPYRQMNPAEISAFYEDLKRFAGVSTSPRVKPITE